MKRSPLKRRTPLGPRSFAEALSRARAAGPKRRKPITRKPPRRRERESVFSPYVAWLHEPGGICVVCGSPRNLQGSHVAPSLGTGAKHGLACDMVRMCGGRYGRLGCHQMFDQRKGRFIGWSDAERAEASRTWRLLHWSAFSAWVGIVVGAGAGNAAELLACEEAIAEHRERTFGKEPTR